MVAGAADGEVLVGPLEVEITGVNVSFANPKLSGGATCRRDVSYP